MTGGGREAGFLGPADVRSIAERLGVSPTKRWGQNFVVDANTVRRIVREAHVGHGDVVLEVGPGLGSLTLALLAVGARVLAVEIDERLAAALPGTVRRFAGAQAVDRLGVVATDALTVSELPGAPVRLVANLPYNVSVPVLLHLLERFESLRAGVVMVQSEVGERLAASPGSRIYGAPSVKAAWYGRWRVVGTVSRQVFWPVPNVDSVLVAFERGVEPGAPPLRESVFALVDAAFAQRRKMLRGALATHYGSSAAAASALESVGIDATTRGERLTVGDFVRLAEAGTSRDPETRSKD